MSRRFIGHNLVKFRKKSAYVSDTLDASGVEMRTLNVGRLSRTGFRLSGVCRVGT